MALTRSDSVARRRSAVTPRSAGSGAAALNLGRSRTHGGSGRCHVAGWPATVRGATVRGGDGQLVVGGGDSGVRDADGLMAGRATGRTASGVVGGGQGGAAEGASEANHGGL